MTLWRSGDIHYNIKTFYYTTWQFVVFYQYSCEVRSILVINDLTPELNLSAQRCMTRFFTRDFDS
jgi:hypothetical protein